MSTDRPGDIHGYREWLKEQLDVEITARTARHYDSVTLKMREDFEGCEFWVELLSSLREFDSEYRMQTGYPLLAQEPDPRILIKTFESFYHKTFRKNVLRNEHWPAPPAGGWIVPENWYSRINDILRTLFVVKYLDGVDFLRRKIHAACAKHGLPCDVVLEAREEGYYAAHVYTRRDFEISKIDFDTKMVDVSIELQVTTQLQEAIRTLLHKYYEKSRTVVVEEASQWQWDYRSGEFVANYLGHILHYVEGMIMEIRERQTEEDR